MINMGVVKQTPSPNFSNVQIAHDLFILHLMEGCYLGSVAWLCRPEARASAHYCSNADGSEVSQLVPFDRKAWAECNFNGRGISGEYPGFTAQGVPDVTLRAMARHGAWILRAYGIPCQHAAGGQGRGYCMHNDLGVAGGGHVDVCGVGDSTWQTIERYIKEEYDALGDGGLPPWALHGAPAPQSVVLPPAVTPEPTHGGADRSTPGDVHEHPTASGFPLASRADVQWRLRKVGANPQLGITGTDNGATHAALGTFQRAYRLPVTNELNPATWAALAGATA